MSLKFLLLLISVGFLGTVEVSCKKKKKKARSAEDVVETSASTGSGSRGGSIDDVDEDILSGDDDEDAGAGAGGGGGGGGGSGFGSDPALLYFDAATGVTTDGDIVITIDYPSDVSGYDEVKITWKEGGTAPNATCSDATGTRLISSGFSGQVSVTLDNATDSLLAGTVYSFRMCIENSSDSVIAEKSEAIVASKGTIYWVFVSSVAYTGNLVDDSLGTTDADERCDALGEGSATAGARSSTWKAIISGDGANADGGRITMNAKLYNLAGEKIADDNSDLWDGSIDTAITYDENGGTPAVSLIWTGTSFGGQLLGTPCLASAEWDSIGGTANYGNSASTGVTWIQSGAAVTCANTYGLYCISQ